MTVGELLDRVSSRELTEWAAYEKAFGPLGGWFADEALADLHEVLQRVCLLLSDDSGGSVQPYPRRLKFYEFAERAMQVDASEQEEFDARLFEAEMQARERGET